MLEDIGSAGRHGYGEWLDATISHTHSSTTPTEREQRGPKPDLGKAAVKACQANGIKLVVYSAMSAFSGTKLALAAKGILGGRELVATGKYLAGLERGNYGMFGKDDIVLGRAFIEGGRNGLREGLTVGALADATSSTAAGLVIDNTVGNGGGFSLRDFLKGLLPFASTPSDYGAWKASCFPK